MFVLPPYVAYVCVTSVHMAPVGCLECRRILKSMTAM